MKHKTPIEMKNLRVNFSWEKIQWNKQMKFFGLDHINAEAEYGDFHFEIRYDYEGTMSVDKNPDHFCLAVTKAVRNYVDVKLLSKPILTSITHEIVYESFGKIEDLYDKAECFLNLSSVTFPQLPNTLKSSDMHIRIF